ncbi:MAG: hypothetical protein QF819_06390 [Gemmatimonadota bacterium]|jgi:hypothetical protein|nr:hypothetical protein [Gemmatimonadota bacterium]MDP6529843.1 hypothetical protein [Gemmatimonadota bacterium]MDP6802786.1 hypothetical protein [Gemmatimonadota bacterium]MDP7032733.1 hypothetical protein [Gemmatimonadota bacterium]
MTGFASRSGITFSPRSRVGAAACLLLLLPWAGALADETASTGFLVPSRVLVDSPTAGLLPPGTFESRARVFPGGGVEFRVDIGLQDWITVGAGFGGLKVIGDGEPDWNPHPGILMKVRVAEETYTMPAFVMGVDTQGAGYYDTGLARYQFKSRGVYAVLSKNYAVGGDLSIHSGVSRSLEDLDDSDPTLFVGAEKSLGDAWSMVLEYDLATNDDLSDGVYGRGRGYFNAAFRWSLAPDVEVRFVIRDMLRNSEKLDPGLAEVLVDEGWGREFTLSYAESF